MRNCLTVKGVHEQQVHQPISMVPSIHVALSSLPKSKRRSGQNPQPLKQQAKQLMSSRPLQDHECPLPLARHVRSFIASFDRCDRNYCNDRNDRNSTPHIKNQKIE